MSGVAGPVNRMQNSSGITYRGHSECLCFSFFVTAIFTRPTTPQFLSHTTSESFCHLLGIPTQPPRAGESLRSLRRPKAPRGTIASSPLLSQVRARHLKILSKGPSGSRFRSGGSAPLPASPPPRAHLSSTPRAAYSPPSPRNLPGYAPFPAEAQPLAIAAGPDPTRAQLALASHAGAPGTPISQPLGVTKGGEARGILGVVVLGLLIIQNQRSRGRRDKLHFPECPATALNLCSQPFALLGAASTPLGEKGDRLQGSWASSSRRPRGLSGPGFQYLL